MNTAVIGLGSNIEPERNIEAGKIELGSLFRVIKTSTFLKTKPQGNHQQPEFINGGVLIETPMSQSEVKSLLKDIEIRLGRTSAMHSNRPRIIDFDIHVWNGQVVDPFFYQWDFIRAIVLELIPDLQYDHSRVVGP